jgi:trimeric autotransporter adhesin
MYRPIHLSTATLPTTSSMNRSPLRRVFPAVPFALALGLFSLLPTIRAVTPAPDGGYPNGNTAEGEDALFSVTSGFDNVAVGFEGLYANTSGIENTGTGYRALYSNTTGTRNTATGNGALSRNTIGSFNTATGLHAVFLNTSGKRNTGEGAFALNANTTGSDNIAVGYNAGSSLTSGNYNIDIGNVGAASEAGTLRIGTPGKQSVAYMAGIYGATEASGVNVTIGPDGHLGTVPSSARFKEAIKPMDKVSEAILSLHPVTFRYKHEIDPNGIPQFGLVAEDVEKVDSNLVARDENGKVSMVRYEAVNAMLLNEFLKEHRKVEEQQAYFESKLAQQQKQIEALSATIQKVSEKLELTKAAPQLVTNP